MDTEIIIAFIAGLGAIGFGVWQILESRKLAGTQTVPAGEVSGRHGRVCVHGRAEPIDGKTVAAPVSKDEVLLAKAWHHIERREPERSSGTSGGSGNTRNKRSKESREVGSVATAFRIDDVFEEAGGVRVDGRRLNWTALEQVRVEPHPDFLQGQSKARKTAESISDMGQLIGRREDRWYTETQLFPGQEVWILGTVREGKDGFEVSDEPVLHLRPLAHTARKTLGVGAFLIVVGLASIGIGIGMLV